MPSTPDAGSAVARASAERLARAVDALAERAASPDLRAQLRALSAVLGHLDETAGATDARLALEHEITSAMQTGDEPRAVAAMRRLAALERGRLKPVDWSAMSRG